ncbi:RNA-binding domain-containing protein, partial [Periconia macrospinosa]
MSDYDSSSSDEEKKLKALKKAAKKEKKEKKDKKKSKSSTADAEEDNEAATALTPSSSKKRKRELIPEEIEIDVNLPEPASKKAARKAKKLKSQPTPTNTNTEGAADSTTTTAPDAEKSGTAPDPTKRSAHSVWIGNLPWTATKDLLLTFLTTNADIKPEDITRIHMPAPKAPPRPNWTTEKPQNKGFAYVDFANELAMYSAIALTETRMDNRPLLIKNSKNFEGRPDKPKDGAENGMTTYAADGKGAKRGGGAGGEAKAPNQKVFVGNLAFETSKEDLETHFAPCGAVEHIHMATFEDSGKSKGFAWVTFGDIEAATCAVKGFVFQTDDAGKKRKWKLNKLMGRDLRCEFAEDGTTRYQKRFGGGDSTKVFEDGDEENVHPSRRQRPFKSEGRGGGGGGGGGGGFKPRAKVDPRNIAPGKAHANAPRASAAIVESQGTKTTF